MYSWLKTHQDETQLWQHRRAYQPLRLRVNELFEEDRQQKLRSFMALDEVEEADFVYEPADILKELLKIVQTIWRGLEPHSEANRKRTERQFAG